MYFRVHGATLDGRFYNTRPMLQSLTEIRQSLKPALLGMLGLTIQNFCVT